MECGSYIHAVLALIYSYYLLQIGSRDSVFDVSIRLWYGRLRVRIPAGKEMLSYPKRPARLWSPPSLLLSRYRCSFPGSGHDINHSPPCNAFFTFIYLKCPIARRGSSPVSVSTDQKQWYLSDFLRCCVFCVGKDNQAVDLWFWRVTTMLALQACFARNLPVPW